MSDNPQDRIAQAWNEAVDRHVAGLSDTELADLLARTRSQAVPATPAPAPITPGDTASVRRSIAAGAAQLWAVTQQCGADGYTAGMADAAAARAPQPAPQPQPPTAPTGFGVNRAQAQSGDGNPPAPVLQQQWGNTPRIYPGGTL